MHSQLLLLQRKLPVVARQGAGVGALRPGDGMVWPQGCDAGSSLSRIHSKGLAYASLPVNSFALENCRLYRGKGQLLGYCKCRDGAWQLHQNASCFKMLLHRLPKATSSY